MRRNSLRIDDTKERSNETWEGCEEDIDALFKGSLGIEKEVVIERPHRVKIDKNKKSNIATAIVCRILNYKIRLKYWGMPKNWKVKTFL